VFRQKVVKFSETHATLTDFYEVHKIFLVFKTLKQFLREYFLCSLDSFSDFFIGLFSVNYAEYIDNLVYNFEDDSVISASQFPISFEGFPQGFTILVWRCQQACFYSRFYTLLHLRINEGQINILYIRMVSDFK